MEFTAAIEQRDSIMWSRDIWRKLYLHFRNVSDHETC